MLPCAAAIALTGVAAHAHHSIASIYDTSKRVTVEGIVARLQFVHPHPLVLIDVKDGAGSVQPWRLEMDNLNELVEIGFKSDTLKPGDRVVVSGSPNRTQAQSIYLRRLDRSADGFWYEQVGQSPSIGHSSPSGQP
jgi:DNA/RNA endonuclease YhcR with UshA esterase domain